ncbi:MAG: RNA methyltransferase [Planctomycetota bacterium]
MKNPIVRRFRAAAAAEDGLMLADGVTLVAEALVTDLGRLEVAISPRLQSSERGAALLEHLRGGDPPAVECSDEVMARVSSLTTHQGVAAVLRQPMWSTPELIAPAPALLVIAAGVRDPGNLGALIRTAEAAGATGLVTVIGTAHPFRDKAVRGASGSVLRLPILAGQDPAALADSLRDASVDVVLAERGAATTHTDIDLQRPSAIVLGGETSEVPEPLAQLAAARIGIPMRSTVESLNVAVAAGIVLYEAHRQRQVR